MMTPNTEKYQFPQLHRKIACQSRNYSPYLEKAIPNLIARELQRSRHSCAALGMGKAKCHGGVVTISYLG